ncbi:hypothetical protein K5V21_00680 [Clostridium sardiniense]|uniref:Lipoprotein n=1 Tax=Clostridium sardiniense TaxID=29369 RepID=A0ABS7KT21_CLOSR|nr:hypothetical protein [Clostridium sardiniense]MBY0753958.1 hypothetical protein [Clostridium sardiniense]
MIIRGKGNMIRSGVIITMVIAMLFTIGCNSPKSIEESSILSENVKEDSNKNDFKVVSKEEYKITDNKILDAIIYGFTGIEYLMRDDGIYAKLYKDDDEADNESGYKSTKEKLLFKNGEVKIDPDGEVTKSVHKRNNSSHEIYEEFDGYAVKNLLNESWREEKNIIVENITLYNEEADIDNKKNSKEKKSNIKEKISIDISDEISYYHTIGIINNKLLYASGEESGQFANEIGKIDLVTGQFEDTIKVDPYSQAVIIDENTIALSTISSEYVDLNIFNLNKKTYDTIIKNKNIWDMGVSKNKEKIYYTEKRDNKSVVYVVSISGENKGELCKVYENSNNEEFTVDISTDGKEVYVFLHGAEPKIIKYKLNK